MTPPSETQPERPAAPSERVQLARAALEAALGVSGVVSADAGRLGLRVTADGDERLPGVLVTARAGGGYGVELHLVTEAVPLRPLADRIRERVERAAAGAGLADALAYVDVAFEDVVQPGEDTGEEGVE
jgi:hypothetical protein